MHLCNQQLPAQLDVRKDYWEKDNYINKNIESSLNASLCQDATIMSLAVNMTGILLLCVLAFFSEWMWFPVVCTHQVQVSEPCCCLWAAAAPGWPCSCPWISCFLFPCWLPELWLTPERSLHLPSADPAKRRNAAPTPSNTKKTWMWIYDFVWFSFPQLTCMCCCPGWFRSSVYGGFQRRIFSCFSWFFSFATRFSSAIVWKSAVLAVHTLSFERR